MTIFYYKNDGKIFSISSQETDFRFFKRNGEAYKTIMDFIVLASDEFVII